LNPILEYWQAIRSGDVVVSKKVYRVYRKLANEINKPRHPWVYDEGHANHAIYFIEHFCRHSKGKLRGQLVYLELWQRAFVAALFGFVDKNTGLRRFTKALLFVARKNGKSTFAAAIALYLMVADGEGGPELYAVATKRDQAKAIWEEAGRMIKKSPVLRELIRVLVADIRCDFNDGSFKALGSDSDTLDGLNAHAVLADEVHAWKKMELYDVMADSMSARTQPVFLETSTAGTVRQGVFDQEYEVAANSINEVDGFVDDRLLAVIYELDSRKEWTDEKAWQKANPGLYTIKDAEKLRAKVRAAIATPSKQKNLLCKEFNIRETSSEAWLTFEEINNTTTFNIQDMGARYGIGGCDLSSTTDLTAAKVIFKVPTDNRLYVIQMYWLPDDLLEKRTIEDKIPYDKWVAQGLMRTTPGNKVHPHYVTQWFQEIQNDYDIYIPWIGYDAWSATYWVEEMRGSFGKESMIAVHQGKRTLSAPMKQLGADLASKLVIYNNNPIDKWCLTNTAVEVDRNDNIQPCKTSNARGRIDGTAALLNAYVILLDKEGEYMSMI
jgi:phage terminase large subunit-like protein